MQSNPSSRRWTWTFNNPQIEEIAKIKDLCNKEGVLYLIFQLEKGEKGTPHLQGYIRTKNPIRFSTLKNWFPRAPHLEKSKGTDSQNKKYCSKEEGRLDGPWEFGTCAEGQGTRCDLAATAEAALNKDNSLLDIVKKFPSESLKYFGNIVKIRSFLPAPERDSVKSWLLVGPTGTGKTTAAFKRFPGAYRITLGNCGTWFDGYNGEDVLIIDEFAGQMPATRLIPMLDKFPLRIESKGGSYWAAWTTVVITSNYLPEEWYDQTRFQSHIDAINRRIEIVNIESWTDADAWVSPVWPAPAQPSTSAAPAPAPAPLRRADALPDLSHLVYQIPPSP